MVTSASPEVGGHSSWRARIAAAFVAVFAGLLLVGAYHAVTRIRDLADERRALAETPRATRDAKVLVWAYDDGEAFTRFRNHLRRGDRFLLTGSEFNAGLFPLLAGFLFYPAIRVDSPEEATHIVVFGLPDSVPGFERIDSSGSNWLGRRSS